MGIKADIDEAVELWKNSSFLMKIFIGISLFLTVSSIASLSNAIFAWKGFILDGIEFYRTWIGGAINKVTVYLNFTWSKQEIDFMVIGSIFATAYVRELWVSFYISRARADLWFALAWTAAMVFILVFLGYKFSILDNTINWTWFITGIGVTFAWITYSYSPKERVAYFFPILFSIIFVLILGAINASLKK